MAGIMHMLLSSASSIVTDAYFNLVTLLLPGNGTNGAQNNDFVDSSSNNFSITRNGNTTQGTFSPFSQTGWSNYFNAASNKLSTTGMTALGSDFTLELWVNPSSFADYNTLFDNRTTDGDANGIAFGLTSAAKVYFYSNASFLITTATAISANAWTHIALVRSGSGSGNVKIYINGVADANTATYTTSITRTAPSIGDDWNTRSNLQFYGYLSNMRATTAALYTSNFTPSLVPLTTSVSSGTCVLLTCQSNRFIDNSASALAITPSGTPSVQAFSPFAPTAAYSATTNGGSGYFDGSGDYLQVPNNAAFTLNGDFTIEAWIYPTGSIANASIFAEHTGGIDFTFNASSNLSYGVNFISYTLQSTSTVPLNAWSHIALTRQSNTSRLYINGVSVASTTDSTTYNSQATNYVGYSGATYFPGYISNFRLVKGTAVYTGSTYTVPTAPLTAITNTSLLLSATNAGIIDNAAKNDLETVGNAQISTTQSKFGGSSMYFDGTGDWLYFPTTPIAALGDFTIEGWFYSATATSAYQIVFALGGNSSLNSIASVLLALGNSSTGPASCVSLLCSTNGSSWVLDAKSSNGVITDSAWYHFAVVRSGGTISVYINGTSVISSTAISATTSLYVGTVNRIGAQPYSSPSALNGFIDDFRVTNGYARYTSNFTVPSAAFPLS